MLRIFDQKLMEITPNLVDTLFFIIEIIHFAKSGFGITAEVLRTDTDFPWK